MLGLLQPSCGLRTPLEGTWVSGGVAPWVLTHRHLSVVERNLLKKAEGSQATFPRKGHFAHLCFLKFFIMF